MPTDHGPADHRPAGERQADRLRLGALRSDEGERLLTAAADALAGGSQLAAGERLRAAGHPPDLVAAAFYQAELRVRAAAKFHRAGAMFFTRDGLEQATSEHLARHRAARFAGRSRLVDLCTGIGGDLIALAAAGGREVLAVDRDPAHLAVALHNVSVYEGGAGVAGVVADARDADLTGMDGAFADPARRAGGRRSLAGEPPLSWCFGLATRVGAVGIKAAPGLDLALVPDGWEAEFVADRRDLREAALYSPVLATARRRATVLSGWPDEPRAHTLAGDGRRDGETAGETAGEARLELGEPGSYLYDPSPAVTRAGLVADLGRRLGAWQVDPLIAFLTSDAAVATPFARTLRVERSLPFDVRALARALREDGIGAVDIRRRGLAGDTESIRRRILPPAARRTGRAAVVVMTRVRDRPWAFVCSAGPAG